MMPGMDPMAGGMPMAPGAASNPMLMLQNLPPEMQMQLLQIMSLLGGVGGAPTGAGPMSPTLAAPGQPQPAAGIEALLGGLGQQGPQNPMQSLPPSPTPNIPRPPLR